MRLLVASFAFPPFNSIGGVRVGKTVKYLSLFGHDVRVVTAREQPFPPTLEVELPADRIVYSRWLSARSGARKKLAGSAAGADAGASRAGGVKASLRAALGAAYKSVVEFPDSNVGWLPFAVADAARAFGDWRPELILASSPPPTSLLVARRLSRKFGVPWVADLRDLWLDHPYYEQPRWRRAAEGRLERRVLSSAGGFVTVSAPLAETLKAKYGREAAVVLNGFDPEDYPPPRQDGPRVGPLRILYTGMIYPGKRDPSPLFEALGLLGGEAGQVRVVFHGSFLQSARELSRRYGVERLVEVNDPVPYRESLRLQREADVLLLLLWTDASERGVYTGKLFEYLGARRPVLAVGGDATVAADLIRARGAGAVLSDPARIAERLRAWIAEKRERGAVAPLGDEVVAGISREEQTRVLEEYLLRVLGGGRAQGRRGPD